MFTTISTPPLPLQHVCTSLVTQEHQLFQMLQISFLLQLCFLKSKGSASWGPALFIQGEKGGVFLWQDLNFREVEEWAELQQLHLKVCRK